MTAPDVSGSAKTAGVTAPEAFQIPSLDGIRAFSFLIVFVAHAGLGTIVPGYVGLTVFFFLSGYLITTLLRMELDRHGSISLKQFYLRRTLRIFPPMYLVLAVACAVPLLGWVRGSVHATTVLVQAAHLTNYYIIRHGWWDGIAPGTWVYWSLAVEEHFYLVFPLLYIAMTRYLPSRRRQAATLLGLSLAVLAWRCVLVFGLHASKDRVYLASDTRVDSILFGCILALWRNPMLDTDGFDDKALKRTWLPFGIVVFLASLVVRVPEFEQTLRYSLQGGALIPIFVACIRWHDRGFGRLLNWRPVRYVGVVSYSLYLMHTSLLWAFEERSTLPRLVRGPLAFAILMVLAALMHRYVEKPCARLRREITRLMGPEATRAGRTGAKPMAA
ncbi:MAG TPA: acyltransferase [Polyangiaceae bacterium]|nr:acyltransferase [Polyangiaceae bacterium]